MVAHLNARVVPEIPINNPLTREWIKPVGGAIRSAAAAGLLDDTAAATRVHDADSGWSYFLNHREEFHVEHQCDLEGTSLPSRDMIAAPVAPEMQESVRRYFDAVETYRELAGQALALLKVPGLDRQTEFGHVDLSWLVENLREVP